MKPVCDASEPGSETAHKGAVRALTNATALETLGEVGAVRACEDMLRGVLLSLGKRRGAAQSAERCIQRALSKVNQDAVASSIEGARAQYVPPQRTRHVFPDATPANDIEPGGCVDASLTHPATSCGPSLPCDVAGLLGAFGRALDCDSARWPAEVLAVLGPDAVDDAAVMGCGIVGDEARELLRSMAATNEGRAVLVNAGFIRNGSPWGPVAKGAAPALLAPVFGPKSGPVGFSTMAGDIIGEAWPVGLRWPADIVLGAAPSSRPCVIVGDTLDALAFGGLAFGLAGEDGRVLSLDVLTARSGIDWAGVIEGRAAVVVALPRESPALTAAVKAAKAAGVPVIGAGTKAKTWRAAALDIGRRAVVEHWRAKAREVLK
jgi:hypothetical protein